MRVGTAAWLKEEGADISAETLTKADQLSLKGMIPLFVSSGKYSKGLIVLHREITFDTISALHRLQKLKLRLMLLTGGNKRLASYIKKQTNINEVRFELFPEQKARELQLMRTRKAVIALLGDMELDREAMEAADVRIAGGLMSATGIFPPTRDGRGIPRDAIFQTRRLRNGRRDAEAAHDRH